ncbi:MAG: carboxypeptidase-like regulatory domain-containing protein, partial [Bryobacteraceae bacterium]
MFRRVLFPALWLALRLTAQTETATLSGIVTDPAGAVIPAAVTQAMHEATGITAQTVSNADGYYMLSGLRPGTYTLTVSAPAFKTLAQTGIVLQVNQAARLDVTLPLGATTEQITVSAETPLLETETSGRGAVIDERKIVELPLNGRDYNLLAQLSPGVLPATPRLQSIGFKG